MIDYIYTLLSQLVLSWHSPTVLHVLREQCFYLRLLWQCLWVTAKCSVRHSVMSNSLWCHGLQQARLPCPSLSPGQSLLKLMSIESVMSSNHLILCHPLLLLLSIFRQTLYHLRHQGRPQSFPASRFFLMSQLFRSGGQSIGASAAVLPMNIHDQS